MKTLYFVNGVPTPAQFAEADKMEGTVEFRDINLYDPEAELEKCDRVAGDAPTPYVESVAPLPTEKVAEPVTIEPFSKKVK